MTDPADAAANADPAELGRGPLTRRLPVLWQAPPRPPETTPFTTNPGTTPTRFTVSVLASSWRLTVPAAVLSIAHFVGEALVPVLIGLAIDRALTTTDGFALAVWLLVLGLNFLVLSLAFRFAAQLTARAAQLVQHRLRSTLSSRVLHPRDETPPRPDGRTLSILTNDTGRLSLSVGLLVYPIGELAGIVFVAIALLMIHWPLGLTALLATPLLVWSMSALSGPFSRSRRAYQALLADTVGQATDLMTGYRVIKGVRAEREAARRYVQASGEALGGAHRNIAALGRYLAGSTSISAVFVAALTGLAAWFAVRGHISVGELIAAAGLAQALLPPLTMLTTNAGASWASALASGGRILDVLKESPGNQEPSGRPAPAVPRPSAAVPIVEIGVPQCASVRIDPGELVGIRADDRTAGCLAHALLHPSASAEQARVKIESVAASRLDSADYRSLILVAPHDATLFSGSVGDNLNVPGAPPGTRAAALSAAACDDVISALPDGLDSQVGENGNRLSGGQRQRLALARAFARDAPVLVLHEPTTAVDSLTEAAITGRLRDLRRGRTTIVIASSPSLLGVCDRIVTLDPQAGRSPSEKGAS